MIFLRGNFKKNLTKSLENVLNNEEITFLPRGYQQLGHVVVLNLHDKILNKKIIIAKSVKELVSNCKTVCLKKGKITGEYRKPQLELLIGTETETIVVENNIKYHFDIMEIMFAQGNVNERRRYIPLVKENEIIFDFFAGIGYFSLGLAKFSLASKIYSFEINPISYNYLLKNIKMNKIDHEKLIPIHGDCRKNALDIPNKADRILMGMLPSPKSSLKTAFKVLNEEFGIIHYEGILHEDDSPNILLNDVEIVAKSFNRKVLLQHLQKIKSYRPHINHVCLDIEIT